MVRAASKAKSSETNSKKLAAFDDMLKILNKEIDSETGTLIAKLSDRPLNVESISSGSVVLDSISGGGLPKGRVIEIYGAESSGKTSIALTAAGNVQKEGGTVAFIDLENALDPRYARKLGVNTDQMAVAQPDHAEQALELVERLAGSGVVDLIIIDSAAALVPKAELEGTMEQQSMAVVARLLSRSLKKLVATANRNKTTVIFINQTRSKVGFVMGNPEETTGGKALKFYSSLRIRVAAAQQIKDGTKVIGREVKMKIVKNKIAPPFGEGVTVLTFNKGINRAAEMIEVGPMHGVIEKPNSRTYIEIETGETIGNSKANAVAALEADPKMFERLTESLRKALSDNLFSDDDLKADSDDESEENIENELSSEENEEFPEES